MKTIVTVKEAVAMIQRTVRGTMAISVDAVTVPDLRKTGNPFVGKIVKACTMNGLIGFDYETSVNNQAGREGKEERDAKPRKWGVLTADRLFVEHKGQYYLQMKVQSASTPIYRDLDGNEIPLSAIEAFMPPKAKSSTQADLEKEIVVRDVKVGNLRGMRFCGADYEIIPDAPAVNAETTETKATVAAPVLA